MATTQKTAVSAAEAGEYIRRALVEGKLNMKTATTDLGWAFPRIRSRAKTICKKMNGTFEKESRGIYYFQPREEKVGSGDQPAISTEEAAYTDKQIEEAILNADTKE
jgi:hypothetical protein